MAGEAVFLPTSTSIYLGQSTDQMVSAYATAVVPNVGTVAYTGSGYLEIVDGGGPQNGGGTGKALGSCTETAPCVQANTSAVNFNSYGQGPCDLKGQNLTFDYRYPFEIINQVYTTLEDPSLSGSVATIPVGEYPGRIRVTLGTAGTPVLDGNGNPVKSECNVTVLPTYLTTDLTTFITLTPGNTQDFTVTARTASGGGGSIIPDVRLDYIVAGGGSTVFFSFPGTMGDKTDSNGQCTIRAHVDSSEPGGRNFAGKISIRRVILAGCTNIDPYYQPFVNVSIHVP
jgi:hypothetical protein